MTGRRQRRPAVFLDRDGTVIEEVEYLSRLEEIRPYEGASEALHALRRAGFLVVLLTNQSGVARGYFTEEFVCRTHERLQEMLGFRFDGLYYCPHGPDEGCSCRKPRTGLLERALGDLPIDLGASYMVGDKPADMELAGNAGLAGILVRTGYGRRSEASVRAVRICDNLKDACGWILGRARPRR